MKDKSVIKEIYYITHYIFVIYNAVYNLLLTMQHENEWEINSMTN